MRSLYIALTDEEVGQPSMVKVGIILKQILKQAVVDGIILRNPCNMVEASRQKKSKVGKALDKDGVSNLMSVLDRLEATRYPLRKTPGRRL